MVIKNRGGTQMYARTANQDNSAPGSLESMGHTVDGHWKEVQCGSQEYRVPDLLISLFPVASLEASVASIHLGDVESSASEIRCTILDEVRQAADGSSYMVPRLRITVQVRQRENPHQGDSRQSVFGKGAGED
jgi:hypothetical protein